MNPDERTTLKTSRIEALSDGIFAIAMTILVLSFEIVAHQPHEISDQAVLRMLTGLWPDFLHYSVSFIILGVFWFQHHFQFDHIKKVDLPLLFINILGLMFIGLIPFTTIMVSDYGHTRAAAMAFELNMLAAGFVFFLHWEYAAKKGYLLKDGLTARAVSSYGRGNLIIPVISLLAMGISWFAPRAGTTVYFLVPFVLMVRAFADSG